MPRTSQKRSRTILELTIEILYSMSFLSTIPLVWEPTSFPSSSRAPALSFEVVALTLDGFGVGGGRED